MEGQIFYNMTQEQFRSTIDKTISEALLKASIGLTEPTGNLDKLLTKKEASIILNICVSTLDNLRVRGVIKSVNHPTSNKVLFRSSDIQDYIKSL